MNKKRVLLSVGCLLGLSVISTSVWMMSSPKNAGNRNLTDEALLALIKNDQEAFESFISAGGNIHDDLPKIDGEVYTVAQGLSYFERPLFAKYLQTQKVAYLAQDKTRPFDIMTLAVSKNNPQLLNQYILEKPDFTLEYGKKGWSLLHMASATCAHKLTEVLHKTGKINWDLKAKDGSTPITLAAEYDCLPMLSYWKEQGADFKLKDGRGKSALNILRGKKDAALAAFAESFEERKPATVAKVVEPDFYKKRKIPKDQVIDYSSMIEPEERPLEATETAEFSEFAD